jgi:NADPH:quinone reductase-like Zn-dependent oxidoreductase
MKAQFTTTADRGVLQYGEINDPTASGHGVLIDIHHTSMNPHDWKYYEFLKRLYNSPVPLPKLLLGHDVSGVVVDVGHKVTKFNVGDEVYAMSAKTGAFAEMITIDQRMAALKPQNLTHEQAATVPMAALTALQAWRIAGLQAGAHVLVVGGSGGVGVYAVQLAKARGAEVTAVCSTKNVELVKSLGADTVIDYTLEDCTQGERRFDIVFDTVGTQSIDTCDGILNIDGHFISTLTSAANIVQVFLSRLTSLAGKNRRKRSTLLALPRGKDLLSICDLIEAGKVQPIVDKTFELADMEKAMTYNKTGRTRGKISIKVR